MDFTLSEEQEMLRTMARDFLTDKCPKTLVKEMEEDEKGYSPELWKEMVDLGWMGLVIPEEYGGSGMSFLDLSILLEEMGRACLPGPFFSTVVLGGLPILEAGNDDQKQTYLTRIASGEAIFSLALTEADAQYGPASIAVKAAADNDGYTINGTKLFVPDAHIADYLLCVARTDEKAEAEKGLTVFIVDAKSPGISCTVLKTIAGDKLCEVVFEGVKVPKENILGELNRGWEVVQRIIQQAAVAKCSAMVGALQRMLEMTVDYAKERVQYDHPIGSLQVIQHYCANMATDVDGSRFSTYQAAWRLSEGLPARKEAAIAKAWLSEAGGRVIALAHQIHGAIGCTIDHDLQYYTRRAKAAQLSFGDADFFREAVAQEMGL
ncbi:MAG: acyl-CoA dehydrogenase family protein [Dehalococcoidales bacterium]|nr:acyl-CoA dehydrogenase family protein [Dehalococcoidales bacterium]